VLRDFSKAGLLRRLFNLGWKKSQVEKIRFIKSQAGYGTDHQKHEDFEIE
jgi:hypothetical protein